MKEFTRFGYGHKTGLINFPGGAGGGGIFRRRASEAVDALAALAVIDISQ